MGNRQYAGGGAARTVRATAAAAVGPGAARRGAGGRGVARTVRATAAIAVGLGRERAGE